MKIIAVCMFFGLFLTLAILVGYGLMPWWGIIVFFWLVSVQVHVTTKRS